MIRATRYEAPTFGASISPQERELPVPTGTEVVVKVSHCGVCHTDLHVHHGGYEIGGGKELRFEDRGVTPPLTLGHEIVGTVAAAGPDATALPTGPVAVYPWIGCGACFRCEREEDHLCAEGRFLGIFAPGGYASHVTVPHPKYLFDIGDIDAATAALFGCSGLTSFGALRKIDAVPKDSALLIIGAGGLGQTALGLAQQMDWRNIVVLDTNAEKRAQAIDLGATMAVDPADLDIASFRDKVGVPILSALDFVGGESTAGFAVNAMDKGGILVVIGLFGGEFRYPLPLMPVRALTVMGSYVGGLQDMADYVDHVRRHGVPNVPVDLRHMSEADTVLSALARGEIAGRTVLVPDQQAP